MASFIARPDPQRFPVGTVLKLYAKPTTPWPESGAPPGSILTEATVEAGSPSSTVTFTGVTEGSEYIAWTSGSAYLKFKVETASASSGVSKAEVETLISEKAVSTESPTFTGTPKAPTATAGTNTTQLATTAFTTGAVATEKTARESADSTLTTNVATAKTEVGTEKTAREAADSTLTTNVATAKSEVATEKARAEAAEVLKGFLFANHASVTTNGTTGTVNQLHPVNDEAESRTIKLPTGQIEGSLIGFEKSSAAANEVAIEGNMRGEAAQTIKLRLAKQTVIFKADSSGSWWPIALYCPLATLTTDTIQRTVSIGAGQVPGNELLAEWKIELQGTEKRTLIKARIRTVSGTIKVAIKRGEAGSTEIAAYKELKGAETEEVVTSEQALSNKDRITVTSSGGSTPKGLFIDIWEKVEK